MIDQISQNYRRHLVAAVLSSRIVCREGCQVLARMHDSDFEKLIWFLKLIRSQLYYAQLYYEKQVQEMIKQLEQSEPPGKEEMIRVLDFAVANVTVGFDNSLGLT